MIIVNTGNGKGKTTAAFGQILRSLGRGWKVCLIQLFKGKEFYGEQKILARLHGLDFFSFAPRHPFCFPNMKKKSILKECARALSLLKKIIANDKKYQLIVLDEFNIALRDGYIDVNEFMNILEIRGVKTNVIVTGRRAPKKLVNAADLVTEMKEIKHPFNKGVAAQRGIEY